ncbi:hypothetical protein [Nonomuraea glycinis]|uniref:hypothetical protein n=1 Tax=Nonomuraea glycinis TaxID=2047744 RepID=UPI0033AE6DF5
MNITLDTPSAPAASPTLTDAGTPIYDALIAEHPDLFDYRTADVVEHVGDGAEHVTLDARELLIHADEIHFPDLDATAEIPRIEPANAWFTRPARIGAAA